MSAVHLQHAAHLQHLQHANLYGRKVNGLIDMVIIQHVSSALQCICSMPMCMVERWIGIWHTATMLSV